MNRNVIRVFEHDTLRCGKDYDGVVFSERAFNALAKFQERQPNHIYTLGHGSIKFSQFVGVLKVGNLTIEVLPKADKSWHLQQNPDEKKRWSQVLIQMLRKAGYLKIHSLTNAHLQVRQSTLFDIYIEHFLNELEAIYHRGWVKKYRRTEGNLSALKGALHFPQHVTRNMVHKERFYTKHQVYDHNHLLHQIFKYALLLLEQFNLAPHLQDKINRLALLLPEVEVIRIKPYHFDQVKLGRKTDHYKEALQVAKMIILNHSPDLQSGHDDVLAILFDMNDLWERYIYQLLRKQDGIDVSYQKKKAFWKPVKGNSVHLEPDFLVTLNGARCIIDTKWKIPYNNQPSMDDLRQMFAYNHYWHVAESILLYPRVGQTITNRRGYYMGNQLYTGNHEEGCDHGCSIAFADVIEHDDNDHIQLKKELDPTIFHYLEKADG